MFGQTLSDSCIRSTHDLCGYYAPDGQPCACACHAGEWFFHAVHAADHEREEERAAEERRAELEQERAAANFDGLEALEDAHRETRPDVIMSIAAPMIARPGRLTLAELACGTCGRIPANGDTIFAYAEAPLFSDATPAVGLLCDDCYTRIKNGEGGES